MSRLEEHYAEVIQLVDKQEGWFSVRDLVKQNHLLAPSTIRRILYTLVKMSHLAYQSNGFNSRNFRRNPNWSSPEGVKEDYAWFQQLSDGRRSEKAKERRRETNQQKRRVDEKLHKGGDQQTIDLPDFLQGAKQSDWEEGTEKD